MPLCEPDYYCSSSFVLPCFLFLESGKKSLKNTLFSSRSLSSKTNSSESLKCPLKASESWYKFLPAFIK